MFRIVLVNLKETLNHFKTVDDCGSYYFQFVNCPFKLNVKLNRQFLLLVLYFVSIHSKFVIGKLEVNKKPFQDSTAR